MVARLSKIFSASTMCKHPSKTCVGFITHGLFQKEGREKATMPAHRSLQQWVRGTSSGRHQREDSTSLDSWKGSLWETSLPSLWTVGPEPASEGVMRYFITNAYLVFDPFSSRAPKILGISLEESDQVSLVMLMRWLSLTLETGCQEDRVCNWRVGLSVPPPTSEGRRGWRLSLWPMAKDALNYNYVVKHLKTQKVQCLESFWLGECTGIWGEWSLSMEAPCPFPMPCPLHLFHLALPVCACAQKPPILLRLHRL